MANGNGATPVVKEEKNEWFADTQKGLAWFIAVAFVALIFIWVFRPPVMAPESMAQLNQLVSTLQNILLLAVGFFFGSSKLAQTKDETQARVAETLAAKSAPTPPPQDSWWGKLTPEEKNTIGASTDPRVRTFLAMAASGNGTADDLAYLVSQGLLSVERANAISGVSVAMATAATVAAEVAAPVAAAEAAPPAAEVAAPLAAEKAVRSALDQLRTGKE